ncbi:MAG: VTT domain-containing protein [Anaerolineae bacterium]
MTARERRCWLESWLGSERLRALIAKYGKPAAAVLFSVLITAVVFALGDRLAELQALGYLGVFVIGVLGNATIILPVPGLAVVFAGGGVLNPLLVGLVAGVGEPLGELTGYLAGYGGSAVVEDAERYERVRRWMERRGFVTLFVLSAVPNPLFDLAGMAAGMLRYPVAKFLLACWLGKTLKAVLIAYLGLAFRGALMWW